RIGQNDLIEARVVPVGDVKDAVAGTLAVEDIVKAIAGRVDIDILAPDDVDDLAVKALRAQDSGRFAVGQDVEGHVVDSVGAGDADGEAKRYAIISKCWRKAVVRAVQERNHL